MRTIIRLALIAAAALGASTSSTLADEPTGDLAKLQGTWTGKISPNVDLALKVTVKGTAVEYSWTELPDGKVAKAELKIDEKASPKTLDWTKATGPFGADEPTTLTIYKLEGDTWTFCSGGAGKARPTKFESAQTGFPKLFVLTRAKDTDEKPIKSDLDKLQGGWTAKVGPSKDIPVTFVLEGNKFELKVTRPGGVATLKGELKLDDKANPKTYDFVDFKGPEGEEFPDNLGIYKLDNDTWTTCSGGPGKERPTKFEAGEGGPPNLATWTRVKDAAEEKPIKGDLAKLQGTWLAPAGPNDELKITMTIKVNAYTASWVKEDGGKIELKGELRVNEKATPNKTIDFFNTKRDDGEDARDSLGIYEFEGETVKFCVGGPGEERPTEFKRGDDGAPHLIVFTKRKD